MSTQTSQAADVASAAEPDAPDQGDSFTKLVQYVEASREVASIVRDSPALQTKLSDHLVRHRDELVGAVAADRKRWRDAADRADNPRDAVQADGSADKTRLFRYIIQPLIGLFFISGLAAALCLIVGYIFGSTYHSARSWRPAGLICLAICVGTFVLYLVVLWLNIFWEADRKAGAYEAAADLARSEYVDVLEKRMLAEARSWLNAELGQPRDPSRLLIRTAPGLGEVYSPVYLISSEAGDELAELINQLSGGATIGLAGPRGAGKTSLIRQYTGEEAVVSHARRVISLLVPAPVEYQPSEFVVHLFDSLIGAYLKFRKVDDRDTAGPMPVLPHPRARRPKSQPTASGTPSGSGKYDQLISDARKYRKKIQTQQSYTTTLSAGLSTPASIATASGQVAATDNDLPWSYPELVGKFCSFLRNVAFELQDTDAADIPGPVSTADGADGMSWTEAVRGCVIVGIDEIDKISDAEQAQKFVNELKAVLGVPYCYYLISVSDDALAAYEMRGLPVRDAFDSAFDEVIHVRYLHLGDSRTLLFRRVIRLPEPFIQLCHCLAGGLPRDLIRVARHAVIAARRAPKSDSDRLDAVCQQLVLDELRRKLDVAGLSWGGRRLTQADSELLHKIQRLVAFQPGDSKQRAENDLEQRLRLRAEHDLQQGRQLQAGLEHIMAGLAGADPPPGDPSDGRQAEPGTRQAEPATVPEVAGYLHYLLTLLEVFTPALSGDGTIRDANQQTAPEAAFDQLCLARQTLGADPRWAWLSIELFRRNWGLTRRYPYPDARPGQRARRTSTRTGGRAERSGVPSAR